MESDSDENESGGVFAMTGIGEEIAENTHKEKPKTRNTTTLRSKLFATVREFHIHMNMNMRWC